MEERWGGFICAGKADLLIAVDYYSGCFEARHGIPVIVFSDNGSPIKSEDFKIFSNEWDFHRVTSSPYHAQRNGRVENAVKSCKSSLIKARADKRDPLLALLE